MASPSSPASPACDRELAGRAQDYFEGLEYDKALETLETLSKARANDPKVAHNLAVARFYAGRDKSTESFFEVAVAAKRRMEGKDGESDTSNDDFDDEAECAVISYNMAVVHYQRRQFESALTILERVFKIVEAVEEVVAQRICLLLLDLYLANRMPDKAGFVLEYLAKTLVSNGNVKQKEQTNDGGDDGDNNQKSASVSDKELLKFYLHQYRARIHIMSRSMKASKREIKSALNIRNQNVTALFLKSNYEYVRRNYRKAVKLLNSCPKTNAYVSGQSLAVLYFNNLGCVHFKMGKYAMAGLYFRKAIEANEREAGRMPQVAGNEQKKLLGTGVSDRLHELVYNQGLVLLHLKKPREAHKCFKTGLLFSAQHSHAWMRLAECCIQDHWQQRTGNNQPDNFTLAKLFGKAQNRKFILKQAFQNTQMTGPLSLSLAITYLNNALHLLARKTEPESKPDIKKPAAKAAAASTSATSAAATATSPMQAAEQGVLRCHALANMAYAYLGTGNLHEALRYAQMLLAEASCPGPIRFLAHVYTAEAYIRLRRFADAMQHLSPQNVGDLSSKGPAASEDAAGEAENLPTEVPPFTAESARNTLLLNLAAAYCIKDDCDQAGACLAQVKQLPAESHQTRQSALLSVFVSLRQGKHDAALEIIQRHQRPVDSGGAF